jgi:hypothetical protein
MTTNRDNGKGDARRPLAVPEEQFNSNWDTIFKKDNPLANKLVKQVNETIKKDTEEFFKKARIIAKKLDNNEYHTPED